MQASRACLAWAYFFSKGGCGTGRAGPNHVSGRVRARWSGPGRVRSTEQEWAAQVRDTPDSKCRTHRLTYFGARSIYLFLLFVAIRCFLGIYHIDINLNESDKYIYIHEVWGRHHLLSESCANEMMVLRWNSIYVAPWQIVGPDPPIKLRSSRRRCPN